MTMLLVSSSYVCGTPHVTTQNDRAANALENPQVSPFQIYLAIAPVGCWNIGRMVAPGNIPDDGRDIFRPPAIPTEVSCLHCGEVYDSYLIEWRQDAGPVGDPGAWCCPTTGCQGLGFLFDIWPTDPEWRDEDGNKVCWVDDEDDESDDFDDPDELWDAPEDAKDTRNFDPTWGDVDRDLPPDPFPPPRHPKPPETGFNEDDIPY